MRDTCNRLATTLASSIIEAGSHPDVACSVMKTTGQSIQLVNGKWMCYEHCSAGSSLTEVYQPSTMTCDADKFIADYRNNEDQDDLVLPQFMVDMGNVGCYTCPAGTSRAGQIKYAGVHDGTMRCLPEEEFGCVTCPAGKQLLCSDSHLYFKEMSNAATCDCYEASAMEVRELFCDGGGGVETAATQHAPSMSSVTATECSGSDGCECDYETQGQPQTHSSFNRAMCLKCPDRGALPGGMGTTCYSCPAGKSMAGFFYSGLSWQGHANLPCFDECPAGSLLSIRTAPSIVTSDKLRCFKTNAAAPTVAEVAPANSTFFVTM
jgi:hypothetical protein